MIMFGDHVRHAAPADCFVDIVEQLRSAEKLPAGIERHGVLCGALILAGELAQAIADADMAIAGRDDITDAQTAVMLLVCELAGAVVFSWKNGFGYRRVSLASDLPRNHAFPACVAMRQPEGYAHYAVYPEAYADAAASLGVAEARVVGLRSIGTSLAAIVAASLGAPVPVTLRPIGHPFRRELRVSPSLAAYLVEQADVTRVIVDEGPGLSGSSFVAVTSMLADAGIEDDKIVILPSHGGAPGSMGLAAHKEHYARLRKACVLFDSLCIHARPAAHRLENWFADLVGPAVAPLQDISGGAWRRLRRLDVAAVPERERRKFLLHTLSGVYLLKFVGLGNIGMVKWQRALRLAAHGFVPEPFGFRHGFMIERWHGDAEMPEGTGSTMIEIIGRYLRLRATLFPGQQGADLQTLAAMARHNIEEVLGEAAARALRFNTKLCVRAIHVDARLHRWEWLALPDGRVLKADALDHSSGHDLIGCQDVAWDIAGAAVEFNLSAEETERLRAFVDDETNPELVNDYIVYYCAFQLALWSPAPPARYLRRLSLGN